MITRKLFIALSLCIATLAASGSPALSQSSKKSTDLSDVDLQQAYLASIFASAVKRPSFLKRLVPINPNSRTVTVISLTRKSDPPVRTDNQFPDEKGYFRLTKVSDDFGLLQRSTWVSLPSELAPKCEAAPDPLLKLQMVLGMPPEGGGWELVRFDVMPGHIFRPCANDPSIGARRCAFNLPTSFTSQGARNAVSEVQNFVFQQMWSSYTEKFEWPGYPFTGMGWTYNWDPSVRNPYGVSEYVVRPGAPVTNIKTVTPAAFCGSPR